MTQYKRYIDNVLSGKEEVCELTRLAVVRHTNDLNRQEVPEFPFSFSDEQAGRALRFFAMLRHTSGSLGGKPFNLQDNQAFVLAMLFGWRRKEDGKRRFTQAYLEMARKAGKSELAAGIELYTGFFEGEEGAQVYTAATTRDQANMVFRAAKKMARYLKADSKTLNKQIDVLANSIVFHPTDSFIQKVSADAGTLDGLNPHCAVIDEYHAHKTDQIKGVMQTGMGSRENPLLLIITTAGFEKEAPCFRIERANAIAVLKSERRQENLFSMIFTLDEGDDWKNEKVWKKANPNLGSTPTVGYLREQVQDAINKGASTRVQVLTKNFNCWLDAPKVWIPEEQITAVMRPLSVEEFHGRRVYLGFDVAATSDLTALSVFSPATDELPAIQKTFLWVPQDTAKRRNESAPYLQWIEDGFVTMTEGNTGDNPAIRKMILDIAEVCEVRSISYDPWNALEMVAELTAAGFTLYPVRPYFGHLSPPTKKIADMVVNGLIEIDENPVLLWNFRNIALDMDSQDNIKPNKQKSGEKIDGVVSSILTLFGWLQEVAQPATGSYLFDEESELLTL